MTCPKLYEFKGKMLTVKQIAHKVNMKDGTLWERLRLGKTIEQAIIAPERQDNTPVFCSIYRQLQESIIGDSEVADNIYC